MLLIAAALTVLIGLYHSIAGEQRLIRPLLTMDTLPRLRGSTEAAADSEKQQLH